MSDLQIHVLQLLIRRISRDHDVPWSCIDLVASDLAGFGIPSTARSNRTTLAFAQSNSDPPSADSTGC